MRLIDADALVSYLRECESKLGPDKHLELLTVHDWIEEGFVFDVLNAPTIDPESLRARGKWTNRRTIEHDGEYWCTACGKEITIYMGVDRKDRYNYCPNCGAKMEVGEDD